MSSLRPVLAACLVIACGSASPSPAAQPSSVEPTSTPTEGGAEPAETAGSPAPKRGKCFDQCQALIEDAGALLAQAKALKGAEQAQVALFNRAAEAHVKAWRGCDLALPGGEDRSCRGAAEIPGGMAEAFEGARRPDGVVYAYLVALDDRWREDGSPIAQRAREDLGARAEAAAKAAREAPKDAHASDALAAAAYAALALDEVTRATELAAEHRQRFGAADPDQVSLVAAAVAAYYVDHEQYAEALAALPASTDPGRAKHPAPKILWHAIRGRALVGAGKPAAGELRAAVAAWREPDPKDPSRILGRQEPAPMLGRESVVDAVGAACFLLGRRPRLARAGWRRRPTRGPRPRTAWSDSSRARSPAGRLHASAPRWRPTPSTPRWPRSAPWPRRAGWWLRPRGAASCGAISRTRCSR